MHFSYKYLHNPFVSGTILLTLAGFITKIIGFFYRIFLSRIFQNEGLGIIGLVAPVSMLVHSVCAAGLQNAITKYVAASRKKPTQAFSYLVCGLLLSVSLSVIFAFAVWEYADFISVSLIHEARTAPLLRILALSFPLASVHSCINGFFYGYKKAGIPSWSIIIEQLCRVLSVYLLYRLFLARGQALPLMAAVVGMFAGECASAAFSCLFLCIQTAQSHKVECLSLLSVSKLGELFRMSCPLSLNRICLSLFATIETFELPKKLIASGLTSSQALSLYGVFSGMAFPLIMFPCAITGSAATLLLPSISEAQSQGNHRRIQKAVLLTISLCFIMGLGCMFFFLIFAHPLGIWLFHSEAAVSQLKALSYLCPFLYLSGMLSSILHGQGKTGITFLFNIIAVSIRLFGVMYLVPIMGLRGYFYGILCSQICLDLLLILALRHNIIYN